MRAALRSSPPAFRLACPAVFRTIIGVFDPVRFILCAALLLAAGCATTPPRPVADWEDPDEKGRVPPVQASVPEQPWQPASEDFAAPPARGLAALDRWCAGQGLALPRAIANSPVPAWSLESARGALILRQGSLSARWEGVDVRLGFPPQEINRRPFLDGLDIQKVLHPLLLAPPPSALSQPPLLVLDPGHGGGNLGARSIADGRLEKEFTLDWARRLRAILSARGWRVLLTRAHDTDLALSNRVAFADQHQADLFISLHFNSAGGDRSQAGLETYYLTPAGAPSSLTRGSEDDISTRFPNNAFDSQNFTLALRAHQALLALQASPDRGVRRARFPGVLRNQRRPAILIEGGYLSNPDEARRIGDPAFRQRLAEALADALAPPPQTES